MATGHPSATSSREPAPDAAGACSLQNLAERALALLARRGTREAGDRWQTTVQCPGGQALRITCRGPDMPSGVPARIAAPDCVMKERPWVGTYRLTVSAPLVVFDICWIEGEPLRIMNFSRGDWEDDLASVA